MTVKKLMDALRTAQPDAEFSMLDIEEFKEIPIIE